MIMAANKQVSSRPTHSLGSLIGSSRRLGDIQSFEDAQQGREKISKILGSAIELLDDVEAFTKRGSQEVPSRRSPESRTVATGLAMSTYEQSEQSERMLRASGAAVISDQSTTRTTKSSTKKHEDAAAATGTSTLDKISTNQGLDEQSSARED